MKREQKARSVQYSNKFWKIQIIAMMIQLLETAIKRRRIAQKHDDTTTTTVSENDQPSIGNGNL